VDDVAITLGIAAASIGALHALAPDHWIPIAAVGRARRWSLGRTARVAVGCGFAHVTVSVALGVAALAAGTTVVGALGARAVSISGALLIGFGVVYAVWGLRRAVAVRVHGHRHHHYDHVHDPSRATVWALLAIYSADACVAVIAILFAAAPLGAGATFGIILVYEVATIGTMVVLVSLARTGAGALRGRWIERWGDGAAGASIALTGVAVAVLGW
jgi:nickel/cobalt transporter (NicO) family protein